VVALEGEQARARRRAELQAIITKAAEQPAGDVTKAVGHADAGAASLSTLLAVLGWSVPASKLSDWIILLGAVAVETGAALSGVLVASVGAVSERKTGQQMASTVELSSERHAETRPDRRESPSKPVESTDLGPEPAPPKPPKRTRKPATKRTARDTNRRKAQIVRLVQSNGGKIVASQQTIADKLRLSKTRVYELIKELEATGQVRVVADQNGTTVALVANAA
jgi:hypothetical protein